MLRWIAENRKRSRRMLAAVLFIVLAQGVWFIDHVPTEAAIAFELSCLFFLIPIGQWIAHTHRGS